MSKKKYRYEICFPEYLCLIVERNKEMKNSQLWNSVTREELNGMYAELINDEPMDKDWKKTTVQILNDVMIDKLK